MAMQMIKHNCFLCGKEIVGKRITTKYCSDKCQRKNRTNIETKLSVERRFLKKLSLNKCYVFKSINLLKEIAALHRIQKLNKKTFIKKVNTKLRKNCLGCKKIFVFTISKGMHKQYCNVCRLNIKKEIRKKHSKIRRKREQMLGLRNCTHRKRARKFNVEFDPKVKPFLIFERDKWTCKICGKKTPQKLKGTYEDDAPELDHIIPLSGGGGHVFNNVQCCCRKCNINKSNKPLGQLLMFG